MHTHYKNLENKDKHKEETEITHNFTTTKYIVTEAKQSLTSF